MEHGCGGCRFVYMPDEDYFYKDIGKVAELVAEGVDGKTLDDALLAVERLDGDCACEKFEHRRVKVGSAFFFELEACGSREERLSAVVFTAFVLHSGWLETPFAADELAEIVGVDHDAFQRWLDDAEGRGYVIRIADREDSFGPYTWRTLACVADLAGEDCE